MVDQRAKPAILLAFCLAFAGFAEVAGETAPARQVVEVNGPSIGRKLKCIVVLPKNYDDPKNAAKRYPVLYLLHGYSGNYTQWARFKAPENAATRDLIVVMPDGGNSWFTNWATSEGGQKNQWEDYLTKDIIGYVDASYRTVAKREGRAINGLSMGGYGSMVVGLRNPHLFCSVGSHSGALYWARQFAEKSKDGTIPRQDRSKLANKVDPRVGVIGFSTQQERTPLGRQFATVADCKANDPFDLVLQVPRDKLPHLHIDCGTEDPFFQATEAFVKLLVEKKIPFTYHQTPGDHNGPYWSREIAHSMAIQYAALTGKLKTTALANSK